MGSSNKDGFNRRAFLKYGSAASVSAIFAGCTGNQEENTTTNDSGDDTNETTTSDQTDTGNQPGTEFDYVTTVTPSSLDPMKGRTTWRPSCSTTSTTTHCCTTRTPRRPNSRAGSPRSTVSEDGQTYTFQLNADATFHNGDQVTASDVKYSVQRMMDMGNGFSWMWSGVPPLRTSKSSTTPR